MKKVLILLSTLIISCTVIKTPKRELDKFSINGDTVLYNNRPVAYLYSMEYEFYRGHHVLEYSLKQINAVGLNDTTQMIVDFVRIKHPKAKVEIKMENKY